MLERYVVQSANGASHAASSVSLRRVGSCSARKKAAEVCRSNDTGMQDLNCASARKELKKLGHACEVKLLPIEVSNGEGMGVGMTVTDAWVAGVLVFVALNVDWWSVEIELANEVIDTASLLVVEDDESVAKVAEADDSVELSCRSSIRLCDGLGGSLTSKCMSPSRSSCLKCVDL